MKKTTKRKDKMTIDKLAQITANQFSNVDEQFKTVNNSLLELKNGQKQILDVVLDIPSKKSFERLSDKVESIDVRLTSVERKIKQN